MPFKTCDKCNKQVGPRTQTCSCGFVFEKTKSQPVKEKLVEEPKKSTEVQPVNSGKSTAKMLVFAKIGTPAGKCPLAPEGFKKGWPDGEATEECVQNWAINAYQLFDGRMTVEAVEYYARQFWEINSPEYQKRILGLIRGVLRPQTSQESHDSDF